MTEMIRTRKQGDAPFYPGMANNGVVEVCLKEDVDKELDRLHDQVKFNFEQFYEERKLRRGLEDKVNALTSGMFPPKPSMESRKNEIDCLKDELDCMTTDRDYYRIELEKATRVIYKERYWHCHYMAKYCRATAKEARYHDFNKHPVEWWDKWAARWDSFADYYKNAIWAVVLLTRYAPRE